jgi:hypothetical protein
MIGREVTWSQVTCSVSVGCAFCRAGRSGSASNEANFCDPGPFLLSVVLVRDNCCCCSRKLLAIRREVTCTALIGHSTERLHVGFSRWGVGREIICTASIGFIAWSLHVCVRHHSVGREIICIDLPVVNILCACVKRLTKASCVLCVKSILRGAPNRADRFLPVVPIFSGSSRASVSDQCFMRDGCIGLRVIWYLRNLSGHSIHALTFNCKFAVAICT